ncbi:MoxR-like ATPase in aerotolerance operon [hydrothermal vent metagenome]|uniref:MoxR-like ATPase in aerotolerance operon n=1 Tax=hydrothermal vent metagenome TaxID=652676 RepID=A0A1W1BE01_9ZZZZ
MSANNRMKAYDLIKLLQERMNESIIGQENIVERLIMALLADGNMLLEGLPGLAKTRAVRAMSKIINSDFRRIQFTPDLTSADVTGSEKMYEENGEYKFRFEEGPIFGNIILADEINRAPAKVQAVMLEAMEERQVTVAGKAYELPKLFIVLATQNPIEQEGTYPLPEAQKDRFLMHVKITYADMESELKMIRLVREERDNLSRVVDNRRIPKEAIFAARREIAKVKMSEEIERYIIALVYSTRFPLRYSKQLNIFIEVGVSPRATLALEQCSRVYAWLHGRDEVVVDDVKAIIHDVFRHRLVMSSSAELNEKTNDDIIDLILEQVPAPGDEEREMREKLKMEREKRELASGGSKDG